MKLNYLYIHEDQSPLLHTKRGNPKTHIGVLLLLFSSVSLDSGPLFCTLKPSLLLLLVVVVVRTLHLHARHDFLILVHTFTQRV